ncbi:nitrous oxide reductase family maturation protein NosD [Paenibacillus puldeungensis]|uniref:Nitrous oxide reductase family maturation protein NosD n=2 Tax=Paenibacillus puldeungensis TaxID=696536 RepID=A0ABW3RZH4_9BACL
MSFRGYSRIFLVLFLVSCLFFMSADHVRAVEASDEPIGIPLQPIIDQAGTGDTIKLTSGTYVGPVVIDKKLTILGDGDVSLINGSSDEAAIAINSAGTELRNIEIRQAAGGEVPAVSVKADHVTLDNLSIQTRGFGILLRDSKGGLITNNKIKWIRLEGKLGGNRGNGIDLYNSDGIQIIANQISYLRDGIYIENSQDVKVDNNRLSHLRYGIHCMYVNGSHVTNNLGEYNYTGAMIMGVSDVIVSGNSFRKQNQNVHAQGILLYDVHTSSIFKNTVEGNRVGIYMEQSSNNVLKDNLVLRNYTGVQFLNADGNRFQNNTFIANVIEASATSSKKNQLDGNYWDAFQGLDVTNDGLSDLPYATNPFYQRLTAKNAAYQLFFQSPGMIFLSDLSSGDRADWASDHAPLTKPTALLSGGVAEYPGLVMFAGGMMLLVSILLIFYLGVFRS